MLINKDIVRIELSIQKKTLCSQPAVQEAFLKAKEKGRLHLLGLVSDGGVHAHINHLKAFLQGAKEFQIPKTFVHFFADGRDTAPRSADVYLDQILKFMEDIQYGEIASIMGRYYAMDRDKRWERTKIAYEGLIQGIGQVSSDPRKTLQERYAADETDEFLKPIILGTEGRIQDEDCLIFFNFRSDRMRQINQVLGIPPLPFETDRVAKNLVSNTFDFLII